MTPCELTGPFCICGQQRPRSFWLLAQSDLSYHYLHTDSLHTAVSSCPFSQSEAQWRSRNGNILCIPKNNHGIASKTVATLKGKNLLP